jgi:hypothetical protein
MEQTHAHAVQVVDRTTHIVTRLRFLPDHAVLIDSRYDDIRVHVGRWRLLPDNVTVCIKPRSGGFAPLRIRCLPIGGQSMGETRVAKNDAGEEFDVVLHW